MNDNTDLKPILKYYNIENEKHKIYKDNRNKCGIYKWTNKINNKSYIGSSINLSNRLKNYFSIKNITRITNKESSYIYNAIIKYGYSKFNIEIIEYCSKDILIEKEQYYINKLNPEYNILKIASSRFGHKYKFESKKSISTSLRKHYKSQTSNLTKVSNNNIKTKIVKHETVERLSLRSKGVNVKIFDSLGKFIKKFPTIKSAAEYLNLNVATIKKTYDRGISYDGYIYEFEPKDIRVLIYNEDHKLVDVSKNAKTVSTKYNIPRSTLSNYINTNKIYKNKYYFYNMDYSNNTI